MEHFQCSTNTRIYRYSACIFYTALVFRTPGQLLLNLKNLLSKSNPIPSFPGKLRRIIIKQAGAELCQAQVKPEVVVKVGFEFGVENEACHY